MNHTAALLAAVSTLSILGCRSDSGTDPEKRNAAEAVPQIQENRLAGAPSTLLAYAADSRINWQPWSSETIALAGKAERMVLVLIASARYNGCFETLDAMNRDASLVERINRDFVPILADMDLSRESSLIAHKLSAEIGSPVAFPYLLILSPEGNPVSWLPINYQDDQGIRNMLDNSIEVIGKLWNDDPGYVISDSATRNSHRGETLAPPDEQVPETAERQRRYERAVRKLASYYDEDLVSMANSGRLFPLGIIDLLTLATRDESLPADLRQEFVTMLDSFVGELITSTMVDPLDGGFHPLRLGSSWNLVDGKRDCATQARGARIFARLHQLTGQPGSLDAAVGALNFAESRFMTSDGLFALSDVSTNSESKAWLWTLDQVAAALDKDEFGVWSSYSNLSDIGNLPSEADPGRNFFRLNSISATISPEEVAEATGIDIDRVNALLDSGRKKLLKARKDRIRQPESELLPSALASFRMVSAYASVYAATGDTSWLEKAINLGKSCRKHFQANRFLNERPDTSPEGPSDGRAFCYAVAVQAGLDLGAVTLEDEWYSWSQDLITLLAEHFATKDGRLLEVRKTSEVIDVQIEDRMMVFDDSSAGLVRLNLQRLQALGFQTPPALLPWIDSVPMIDRYPVVFTDSLAAMAHEWNHTSIQVGPDTPEKLAVAVRTLPLQVFARRRTASGGLRVVDQSGKETTPGDISEIGKLTDKP